MTAVLSPSGDGKKSKMPMYEFFFKHIQTGEAYNAVGTGNQLDDAIGDATDQICKKYELEPQDLKWTHHNAI